jgi:hypothetical protein
MEKPRESRFLVNQVAGFLKNRGFSVRHYLYFYFCNRLDIMSNAVIPAKAGIQCMLVDQGTQAVWIPAFAGMTMVGSKRLPIFIFFTIYTIANYSIPSRDFAIFDAKHSP